LDTTSGECHFFNLEKVIFGPGKVAALAGELDRLAARRTVIATGRTLGASPLLDRVKDAMDGRCVGVFTDTAEHGAKNSAEALAAEMRRLDADSIISFGGGSPNDTAKVAVAAVLSGRRVEDMATLELFEITDLGTVTRSIPHISIPTTLSAGEYTYGGGTTDAEGIKGGVMNPVLQCRVIIYDAELTADTSDILWASTGIRALDHIIEGLYSQHGQSFTDALAEKGLALLFKHLPLSISTTGEERLAHRTHCQNAAFLSNYAGINTRYGVSHAFGHKMGPKWGIAHGITSCISLPHAMRFMASRAPERFAGIAAALQIGFDPKAPKAGADACIARVEQFIASLGLPRSLSQLGIKREQFPEVIENIHYEIELLDTVGSAISKDDVEKILEDMMN
jgi:maleylacetate reductase